MQSRAHEKTARNHAQAIRVGGSRVNNWGSDLFQVEPVSQFQ